MKKSLFSCFSIFFLCSLLCFPKIAFEGASSGLLLWFQTVLPTLFPFMFASKLAVLTGANRLLTKPFAPFLCRIARISEDGVYTLLTGMLCGYPMGSKTCSDFMDQQRIHTQEGRFLVSLCNLPSPMFLFGYLRTQTKNLCPIWLILISVYAPLFLLAILSWYYYLFREHPSASDIPVFKETSANDPSSSLDSILSECSLIFIQIGCYMMLFSVLAAFFLHLPLPPACHVFLSGMMEMTTGIHTASLLLPAPLSWVFMIWFCVFGGFCGLFQIKSVMKNAGLSIRHCIIWKIAHASLSILYFIVGLWISGRLPVHI